MKLQSKPHSSQFYTGKFNNENWKLVYLISLREQLQPVQNLHVWEPPVLQDGVVHLSNMGFVSDKIFCFVQVESVFDCKRFC